MATSKTLTPTNVTIQIPEFTDQPDQRVNSNCIDKEADAINALNNHIGNLFIDKVIDVGSSSTNIQSLETTNSGWFTPETGYTPICVWFEQIGGGLSFNCSMSKGSGGQWIVVITNVHSAASTLYGKVHVICLKNS